MPTSRRYVAVAAILAFARPLHAEPTSFSAPTNVEISPVLIDALADASGGATATLMLRNRGTAPLRIQTRVFRWEASNGVDVLDATQAVRASPPFATIAPGSDYTIRVARVERTAVVGEEAYRVLIDEVPPAAQYDGQIRLTVRYSVPVFVRSAKARSGEAAWRIERAGTDLYLVVVNRGERHLRVASLALVDGEGRSISVAPGLAGYVGAGQSRSWPVALPVALGKAPLHATYLTEAGPQRLDVTMSADATAITSARR